jgi:hypothetical protein
MYIDARVLTATLLVLPSAATAQQACPTGWIPSPANAAWGPRCYLVPPERSTSLLRCVELCANKHEGTPACIGSAEENDFVAAKLVAADGLWLGLYQNETELGPAEGWDDCVGGDAPANFTNWLESATGSIISVKHNQPDDYHGYQQDCAYLDAATGQWRDLACDGGVRFDPFPLRLAELFCLCTLGDSSAAVDKDLLEALKARRAYNERLLTRRTAIFFATATAVAVLPFLLLLGRAGWRRLRRGGRAEAASSVGVQGAAISPSQSATVPSLSTPSAGAASSAAGRVKGKLHAARASAAARRLRVSFAMVQAGWAIWVFSLIPALMSLMSMSIDAAVGDFTWWFMPFPLGGNLLTLALFPTDARAIRAACATIFVMCAVLGALSLSTTLVGYLPEPVGFPGTGLLFVVAAALAPTLRCRGDRAMQPRPALRRLWTVNRLFVLGFGVISAGSNIADYLQGSRYYGRHWVGAVSSASYLLLAALATPRNRGRIHRRLGRLGGRGTEAEDAAAVAALVGGSAPEAALERASRLLRCLPASRLLAADLDDNLTTAPPAGPTLHARTEPAAMGEVTAFLSHSWSDEKEAPGAKHAVVTRWAARRQETTGKEPTLWLVRARPPSPQSHRMHTCSVNIRAPRCAL